MRKSITQESDYGCGIACFAFVSRITYKEAEIFLGNEQANSNRFYVKDLKYELNRYKLPYNSRHIKIGTKVEYSDGMIVLLRRSKYYPVGHYLIRHRGKWMDPWINLPDSKDITKAYSGYRTRLPGIPMYVLYPIS